MSSNIADLLSAYNDSNLSDVWIPSTNETIKFRPIIAAHQQTLLKRLGESSFEMAGFSLALTDIIKSTSTITLDPNKYTSLDKTAIALQLRMHNISDTIDATVSEEFKDKVGSATTVNIADFINALKSKNEPAPVLTVNDGTVKIVLGIPTMADEMTFAAGIQSSINKATDNNKTALDPNSIIGDLVVGTFATFVDELEINGQKAIFSQLPGDVRIQYVKLLNRKLMDACEEHIKTLSAFGKKFTSYKIRVLDSDEDEPIEAVLNIDARMFVES